jgi:hypothetical protein
MSFGEAAAWCYEALPWVPVLLDVAARGRERSRCVKSLHSLHMKTSTSTLTSANRQAMLTWTDRVPRQASLQPHIWRFHPPIDGDTIAYTKLFFPFRWQIVKERTTSCDGDPWALHLRHQGMRLFSLRRSAAVCTK